MGTSTENPIRAFLEINSWKGISAFAVHYYGQIKFMNGDWEGDEWEVSRELTLEEANRHNEEQKRVTYRPGSTSVRYWEEDELRKRAIEMFIESGERGILLEGCSVYYEPQKIIHAHPDFEHLIESANALFEKSEALFDDGGWDNHAREMELICQEWSDLVGVGE